MFTIYSANRNKNQDNDKIFIHISDISIDSNLNKYFRNVAYFVLHSERIVRRRATRFIRYTRRTKRRACRSRQSGHFSWTKRQHDPSISRRLGPRDRKLIGSPVSAPALTDENRPGRVQREKVI